jgi:hypothetical protein
MSNKKLADEMRQRNQRYKNLFSTPDGKKVLEDLIEEFDLDILVSTDPHETYRKIGRREVIKHIQFRMRNTDEDR